MLGAVDPYGGETTLQLFVDSTFSPVMAWADDTAPQNGWSLWQEIMKPAE
jgi:hypothetical protein